MGYEIHEWEKYNNTTKLKIAERKELVLSQN